MQAFQTQPAALRRMTVRIKRGETVVRETEIMGTDTMSAAAQFEDTCEGGEYVFVLPYWIRPSPDSDYGSYGMKCSLCGDPSTRSVCSHCAQGLAARGGKL